MNLFPTYAAQDLVGQCPLTVNTFSFFALSADSQLLAVQQQTTALALSIIMGVLTFGIGHIICKITCEVRKQQLNALMDKILNVFHNLTGASKTELQEAVYNKSKLEQLKYDYQLSYEIQQLMIKEVESLIPKSKFELNNIFLAGIEVTDQQLRRVKLRR